MTHYPSNMEIERLKQSVREHAEHLRRKIFFGEATAAEKERWHVFDSVLCTVERPETPDAMKYTLLRRVLKGDLIVR